MSPSKTPLADRRFLKSDQVRKLLGYSENTAFWVAVHRQQIPRIVINRNRILFDEEALTAWLAARTVGPNYEGCR